MATGKQANRVRKAREALRLDAGKRLTIGSQPRTLALAVGAVLLPWTFTHPAYADVAANALPTGGSYAYGSGSITQQGSNALQITQTTDKGTINWNTFSIGSNASVNFTQPSASSITLNRVLGSNPSEIFGRLTANGQVFLSNPNGVLFAPGASVDVGALFATTLAISDQDANAGRYTTWSNPGNSGSVVNQGTIITANGYTALAGPQVRNDGVILAHAGSVTLAAGNQVLLDMIGDGLIKVTVDEAALSASAINTGTIQADGGNVLLTARSANALLDTVINNSGLIRANSLVERSGEILLDGGTAGVVSNTGTLQAVGTDAGTTGGTVKVLGQYVGLFDGTKIDASGAAGGGTVLIGGNFHGAGPEQNASQTYVAGSASINSDAVASGNGGQVAVWSNDETKFYGSISARGGAQAGNGGFVEVSGKQNLDYRGYVDARAPAGVTGTLLLDPTEITIDSGANQSGAQLLTDGVTVTGAGPFADTATVPATGGTLTDGTINTQLGTANVTVTTSSGDIVISNGTGAVAIGPTTANANTLTLNSAANISWNAGWSYTNSGQLNLYAAGGTISGTGALAIGGTSPVLMQASSGIGSSLSPVLTAGLSQFAAETVTGGIFVSNSTSGNVTITSLTNPVTAAAVNGLDVTTSGDISLVNSAGNINVNQAVSTPSTAATAVFLSAGDGTAAGTTTGGDVTVGGSGSVSIGAGGEAQLFTGSIIGSTGLTALVGSGSGNFRYDSTPIATNYTLALSSGRSAIYREQPLLAINVTSSTTKTYGTNDPGPQTYTATGYVNGDSGGLSGNFGRVAGEAVGTYNVTQGTLASDVGYGFSFSQSLSITAAPLTATIANQSKTYGTSDPTLAGIPVALNGVVNTTVTNWNGTPTTINDTGNVTATLASLTRNAGETVALSPYAITAGTLNALSGTAAGNYSSSGTLDVTGAPTLSITAAPLTATIASQSKTYGTSDPTLAGIPVALSGVVNTTVTNWNGTPTTINDTGNVTATLASLTRNAGETVALSPYAITAGTLNALSGTAAGNYSSSGTLDVTGSPTLTINKATVTGTLTTPGQTKVYGTNDPSLAGIGVTTGTVVNTTVTDWNGTPTTINDSGNVALTLASLTRAGGENVGSYAVSAGTFNAPGGSAGANYTAGALDLTNTPSLSITTATLTGVLTNPNQTKVYGQDDPALGTIGVTLTGLVNNASVSTWNGTVSVNDAALTSTAASLTRQAGENVGTYNVTAGTFTDPSTNYTITALGLGNTPNLQITQAPLTVTAQAGTKVYDGNTSSAVTPAAPGLVNRTVVNWNGTSPVIADGNGFSQTYDTKDVGVNKMLTPTGLALDGNGGANYSYTYVINTSGVITQLGSVAWTGAGGNSLWSNAANWAGNAIPDKANVANVDLSGATVTFDATVPTLAGSVQISNLSNGSLAMNSSALAIGSNLNLAGYNQTGGAVSTGGSFTVTSSFSQSAGTIASTGLVDITQASGALTVLNIAGSNTVTLTANTSAGDITLGSGGALNGTTVTFNAGRNVTLNGGITGTTVDINFGQQVAGTFTPTATISGTTTVTGGGNNDIFDFTSAPSITATLVGGLGKDTLKQNGGKTWNLDNTTPDTGTSGTLTWSSIENLQDSGAGVFNMGTAGSISGALEAVGGTINYGSYATPVTFSASNVSGGSTGITDTWTGITTVTGSPAAGVGAAGDTITGSGLTYNAFNATTKGTFSAGGVNFIAFENINDSGAATVDMTGTTTGGLAGNVTTTGGTVSLGGGTQVGGNVNMNNAGTLKMGTAGFVTGNVSTQTLSYANYATPVTFDASNIAASTVGIGGTWTGITAVTGSAGSDTVTGNGLTYNAFNAATKGSFIANSVNFTGFENINDAGAATVDMSGTTTGGLAGNVTTVGGTVTLGGGNQVGGNVNMNNAGTLNMGTAGTITGSANTATLNYGSYATPVTFSLANASGVTTGVGTTYSGVTTVQGGGNSDTVTGGNGATYNSFNATTKGTFTSGTVNFTSFENINDAGAATVDMSGATTGGLSGNVTTVGGTVTLAGGNQVGGNVNMNNAGTLNMGTAGTVTGSVSTANVSYASYAGPVTFNASNTSAATTGVGTTWSGVTGVTGSAATTDTVSGTAATYNTFNATTKGTFSANGVALTSFENINDSGAATVNMAGTTTGGVSGNVTTTGGTVTLAGGNQVGGNVNMNNAGTLNMGTAGTVTGSVNTTTLTYSSYATPVTFNLNGGASTGMAGWTGITLVTGSAATTDAITGTGTYTITGPNAGNNGTVFWTSFENLNGGGTSTLRATSATWNLTGSNTGTVTNLSGAFSGMANLTDLGTATINMGSSGSITGSLNAGTSGSMTYASYASPVTFSLSGSSGSTTGIGGTRTGVTSVTGSGNSDTIAGAGATYNLTSQNAGSAGTLSWTSFENITDATGGLFNLFVASNNVTGTITSGGSGPATCQTPNAASCANLNSSIDVTALNVSVGGMLLLTGNASSWNLTGAPQPAGFGASNPNANVFFNGTCVGGPACGTVITIVGSIGGTVNQIAAQALQDALDTDSVQKQIDYGFAGDVGTTPPMDHRIDETGISTPTCFEESREGEPCRSN